MTGKLNVVRRPTDISMKKLNLKPNKGETLDEVRQNQMVHFLRRLWTRFGVGLVPGHMPDLVDQVMAEMSDENTLKIHPDGRVVLIANLGRHGNFPVVLDTKTRMLVTALEWRMVRGWRAELKKRLDAKRKQQQQPEDVADQPAVPGVPCGDPS